ncbi:MAG: sulfotransferase family 2 domain-containing protein [Actinobacteria bacterium]|nr:sulfotransferase family 2 domain-containing protein [Actinomycetota bacterium]
MSKRAETATAGRDAPVVIFLHIGKTAGTTMRRILSKQFHPSEVLLIRNKVLRSLTPQTDRLHREETLEYFAGLAEEERARPSLIIAHGIFGLHRSVPRPATYVTMLRDPIALTISQYHYVARDPDHPLHDRAASQGLEEYVRSGASLETDNSQTRALSGDTTTPFGGCTAEMLETAKANVASHFSFVGLTERFDESLLLLGRTFGWTNLYYVAANVTPARRREPVPQEVRRAVQEQNRFDAELYAWASARFDEQVRSIPSFQEDLRRFRRNNGLYRWWGKATYTLPKAVYRQVRRRTEAAP